MKEVKKNADVYYYNDALNDVLESIKNSVFQSAELKYFVGVFYDFSILASDYLKNIPFFKNYIGKLVDDPQLASSNIQSTDSSPQVFYDLSTKIESVIKEVDYRDTESTLIQASEIDHMDVLANVLGQGSEGEDLVDLSSIKSETLTCLGGGTDLFDHCLPQGENQDEKLTDLDQLTSLEQKGDSDTIEKVEKLVNFNDGDYM